tara:strand:- start:251 stop:1489 length:1239 start_codon:yes stop_codon:yes gene_type:complete
MGPCLAPSGASEEGGFQPAQPPVSTCSLEGDQVSSTAWITENGRFWDAEFLGQSPVEGVEDQSIGSADPRVIELDDGGYRMYFGAFADGLMTGTSPDGKNWELGPQVLPAGTPHTSLVALPTGGWRLFAGANAPGLSMVKSFTTTNGIDFVEDPGFRLTDEVFPFGDIGSPFAFEMPDGTYRMYLSTVPKGEHLGQPGGNSAYWMVGATSTDMLTWTPDPRVLVEGLRHPVVVIEPDSSITVYGGEPLTKLTSTDGHTFTAPEYLDLRGMDFDVKRLSDGQLRVYSGAHDYDQGSWLRFSRSSTVSWSVAFKSQGMRDGTFTLDICVTGSSAVPVEIHLVEPDHRTRKLDLESASVSVREGYPPYRTVITLEQPGPEPWLQITDGTAVREWSFVEEFILPWVQDYNQENDLP